MPNLGAPPNRKPAAYGVDSLSALLALEDSGLSSTPLLGSNLGCSSATPSSSLGRAVAFDLGVPASPKSSRPAFLCEDGIGDCPVPAKSCEPRIGDPCLSDSENSGKRPLAPYVRVVDHERSEHTETVSPQMRQSSFSAPNTNSWSPSHCSWV